MAAKRRDTQSVPYLIHFPDQSSAVHTIEIGRVAEPGTEILDGWRVDSIKIIDDIVDGEAVSYAVWVHSVGPPERPDGENDVGTDERLRSDATRDRKRQQLTSSETLLGVSDETKQKIESLPDRLGDEFADVAPDDVREEVAEVAEALLSEAKFEDFVPLLAYRYSREHLLEDGREPSRRQPSRDG